MSHRVLFVTFILIGCASIIWGIILKRAAYKREDSKAGIRDRIDGSVFLCMGLAIIAVSGIFFAYLLGLEHSRALSGNKIE
jgi:hypothetical protein